jgi:hypothetical protein
MPFAAASVRRPGMSDFSTEYTSEAVCPYCGREMSESWGLEPDVGDTTCGWCERDFLYYRNIKVTYCTMKISEATNA